MDVSVEEMEKRVARWGKMKPYKQTFIESRLPGFEKRLYKLINRGVLEYKGVEPAIVGSHRFGVTLIEVPVGQGANLHSHKTEEVFFPLNGKMLIVWGERGEHQLMLNQWDSISVPVGVMRGLSIMRPIDWLGFIPVPLLFACAAVVVFLMGMPGLSPATITVLAGISGLCVIGMQFGNISVTGQVFPTYIRPSGVGFC